MATTMSYGGNNIVPVPLINVSKTFQKTPGGVAIGTLFTVTLNGTIINLVDGLPGIVDGQRYLREVFDRDGKLFQIACNGEILFEAYPRIVQEISFQQSPDNWTLTCPYSIVLECDNEPHDRDVNYIYVSGENIGTSSSLMPPFISDVEDSWSFEFDQQVYRYDLPTSAGLDSNALIIRATHDVSAIGKSHYDGPNLTGTRRLEAWQWAKDYVNTKLNQSPFIPLASGLLNIATGSWGIFDHYRVQRISETAGSFGINETFVLNSKNSGVIEEFECNIRAGATEPFTTVSIQGSVQGLERRTYGLAPTGFSISTTKFANASGYFENIKDSLLIYPRAQALIQTEGVSLNSDPLTRVIGKSPPKGLITYQYEYNTRPTNCIAGAKQETISINDENPSDVFSKIVVMGRRQGPILQSFNTVTEFRRNVTIDALVVPPSGCTILALTGTNNPNSSASTVLCTFENDLRTRYNKVYKERDNTLWDPRGGRYSRSVTWVATDCTNIPPISLCSGA